MEDIKTWLDKFFYEYVLDIENNFEFLTKKLNQRLDRCISIEQKLFLLRNYKSYTEHIKWMKHNINFAERSRIAKLLTDEVEEKKEEYINLQKVKQKYGNRIININISINNITLNFIHNIRSIYNTLIHTVFTNNTSNDTGTKITGIGSKFTPDVTKRIGKRFIDEGFFETTVEVFALIFSDAEIQEVKPIILLKENYKREGHKTALRDILELVSGIKGYDNKLTKEKISLFFQDRNGKKMKLNKRSEKSKYYRKFKIWIEQAKNPDHKVYSA